MMINSRAFSTSLSLSACVVWETQQPAGGGVGERVGVLMRFDRRWEMRRWGAIRDTLNENG